MMILEKSNETDAIAIDKTIHQYNLKYICIHRQIFFFGSPITTFWLNHKSRGRVEIVTILQIELCKQFQ